MAEPRETNYSHLDGEDFMEVTACERWAIGMINRLKERFPDEVEIIETNKDGSLVAHLPYKWMRILPKRKMNWTDEQKKAIAERFKAK